MFVVLAYCFKLLFLKGNIGGVSGEVRESLSDVLAHRFLFVWVPETSPGAEVVTEDTSEGRLVDRKHHRTAGVGYVQNS